MTYADSGRILRSVWKEMSPMNHKACGITTAQESNPPPATWTLIGLAKETAPANWLAIYELMKETELPESMSNVTGLCWMESVNFTVLGAGKPSIAALDIAMNNCPELPTEDGDISPSSSNCKASHNSCTTWS
jgi:hypothetical protein